MQETLSPDYSPLTFRDYWEILRIPALFTIIAIAGTWAVWYFTSVPCQPGLAPATGCYPDETARHIHLDLLNKIMTHAVIAAGGGGFWSYAMITRERKARQALMLQLAEEREKAAQEREEAAQEQERTTQELEKAAQEREEANREREQLQATIESLTQRIAELESNGHSQA